LSSPGKNVIILNWIHQILKLNSPCFSSVFLSYFSTCNKVVIKGWYFLVEFAIENSMPFHGQLKPTASTWETSVMEAVVANQIPTAIHTGESHWRNNIQTPHQVGTFTFFWVILNVNECFDLSAVAFWHSIPG